MKRGKINPYLSLGMMVFMLGFLLVGVMGVALIAGLRPPILGTAGRIFGVMITAPTLMMIGTMIMGHRRAPAETTPDELLRPGPSPANQRQSCTATDKGVSTRHDRV